MRIKIMLLSILFLLSSAVLGEMCLIPQPVSIKAGGNGAFKFTAQTKIAAENNELKNLREQLNEFLAPAFGFQMQNGNRNSNNTIVLKLNDNLKQLGEEGYHLKVDSNSILIEAYKPAGVFYGIQTLRQLLPVEIYEKNKIENIQWQAACMEIEDKPRFLNREILLDVNGCDVGVDFIKKQIDLMAMYKLNRLYWRSGDDINKKYTKQQIAEVVRYGNNRFVKVIPETEKANHTSAFEFNYYQGNPAREPYSGSRRYFLPLEQVYRFDTASLTGVRANIRTDDKCTDKQIEYLMWPRGCALAEAGWTAKDNKNFQQFEKRMNVHYAILQKCRVNFFKEKDLTKQKDVLRFMTYNILYGGEPKWGSDSVRVLGYKIDNGPRRGNIINIIKTINPDIVFLQECNGWADDNCKILKDVAGQLKMFGEVSPNRNKFKVAILSRFPISNVHWLDGNNVFAHNIIYADIEPQGGQKITVASLHFGWWGDRKWKTYDANGQSQSFIRQYKVLMDELGKNVSKPFVIGGDFNNSYDEVHFKQKPVYASIIDTCYTDSLFKVYKDYSNLRSGKNRTGPIDYIFVSPQLANCVKDADVVFSVESVETSDHLPIWTDILMKK